MARPRTPSNVLNLRGAFARHPERKRARAQEPTNNQPLGEVPAHFDKDQRASWLEIERHAIYGVLTSSDRLMVEMAAVLLTQFRVLGAAMESAKISRLQALLGSLGMSPADRSKVHAQLENDSENPFDVFGDLDDEEEFTDNKRARRARRK